MRMKKIIALLLAAIMIVGLAACSSGDNGGNSANTDNPSTSTNTDNQETDNQSNPVEISVWSFNVGDLNLESSWDSLIKQFNDAHPEITVKYELITYQDGDAMLTSAIQSGSQPDVLFEGPERIVGNYGRNGLMADLSDLWANGGDIADGIKAVSQLDGTYYLYPLSAAAHCMAINYEVFEAADALKYIDDATRTWTTDDFVNAMAAVRDAINAGTVNVATPGIIYCGAQGGDQGTRALVNNLYSDYYVTDDGSSYNANSANNVKALELLKEMVDNKSLSANAGFAASDELQAFANGTCAVSFCWNYANYLNYAEQTQFTPYAVAFPSDDGVPELEMAGPYGFGIFDKGDDAKIAAAKTFIQFICDNENGTAGAEAVQYTGFYPVHTDWDDIYADAEDAAFRAPFALMSNYLGRYYALTGGWTEQRALWWPMLTEIMIGGTDAQTAADNYVANANANIG